MQKLGTNKKRQLRELFMGFCAKKMIESFTFDVMTQAGKEVLLYDVSIHGRRIQFQFFVNVRDGIDHEYQSSKRLKIAICPQASLNELQNTLADDIRIRHEGYGLEDMVEKAFMNGNRPKWCTDFRKATEEEDKSEGVDFFIKTRKSDSFVPINVKKFPSEWSSARQKHLKKFPNVKLLLLHYPAEQGSIHQGMRELIF
jgi:hypothetical protein